MNKFLKLFVVFLLVLNIPNFFNLRKIEIKNEIIMENILEDKPIKVIEKFPRYDFKILGYKDGKIIGWKEEEIKIKENEYKIIKSKEIYILNEDGSILKTDRKVVDELNEFKNDNYYLDEVEKIKVEKNKKLNEIKEKLKKLDDNLDIVDIDLVGEKIYIETIYVKGREKKEGIYRYYINSKKLVPIYLKNDKNDSFKKIKNSDLIIISEGKDSNNIKSNYYLCEIKNDKIYALCKIGSDEETRTFNMPKIYINNSEGNLLVKNMVRESGKEKEVLKLYEFKNKINDLNSIF